jgi:RNA-binding protein
LETHELIKLKIPADSSAGRKSLGLELATLAGAELIQVLGRTVLLYLARPEEPVIVLPARRKAK